MNTHSMCFYREIGKVIPQNYHSFMNNFMLGGKNNGTLQLKLNMPFFVVKCIPICCPMSIDFSNLNKEIIQE